MTGEVYERLTGTGTGSVFAGVAVGVVTNAKDPDGLGRVKLRLPWLAADLETDWARVAVPVAGAGTGALLPLRVDDEVLVAFEHGHPAVPYVIGALWNGKDHPPAGNADGKGNQQVLRSRSGHVVRLDDTDGQEKIEIIAKGEKSSVVIDLAGKTVTVTGEKDVVVRATDGKLTLSGKGGVEITSPGQVKIEGKGGAEVTSSGKLTLKGSVVNIN